MTSPRLLDVQIPLPCDGYQRALNYAHAYDRRGNAYYTQRRGMTQTDSSAHSIRQQTSCKMAEEAAALYMQTLGYPFVSPDYEIYDAPRKSFAADLVYTHKTRGTLNVHVKSCQTDLIDRGPDWESYTFQTQDKLVHSPAPSDFILLAQVAMDSQLVTIRALIQARYAKREELYLPTRRAFTPPKVAIYPRVRL
jgi:hypothetical protein